VPSFEKSNRTLSFLGTDIPYTLTRSAERRSLVVKIEETGQVRVLAPARLAEAVIFRFLKQKAHWIRRKTIEVKDRQQYLSQRVFAAGQEFLFLGQKFRIEIEETAASRAKVTFDGNRWTVRLPETVSAEGQQHHIRSQMIRWYREQAKEILGGRVWHYGRIMAVQPQTIAIRTQRRIWGSCDYRQKSVRLNWQIVMAPLAVIDYVVVHELCHLTVPNHSRRFWQKVAQVMPDYQKRQKWLKDNALDLVLPR